MNDLNNVQKFTRDTRQKSELALPKCRLATGERAFAFRGAKIFNSLPKFIRDTETLGSFKRRIFNNIFYSQHVIILLLFL